MRVDTQVLLRELLSSSAEGRARLEAADHLSTFVANLRHRDEVQQTADGGRERSPTAAIVLQCIPLEPRATFAELPRNAIAEALPAGGDLEAPGCALQPEVWGFRQPYNREWEYWVFDVSVNGLLALSQLSSWYGGVQSLSAAHLFRGFRAAGEAFVALLDGRQVSTDYVIRATVTGAVRVLLPAGGNPEGGKCEIGPLQTPEFRAKIDEIPDAVEGVNRALARACGMAEPYYPEAR